MKNFSATVFLDEKLIAENADVFLELQNNTSPFPTWQGEISTRAHLKVGKEIYTLKLSDGRTGNIRIRSMDIDSQSYSFSSNDGFN